MRSYGRWFGLGIACLLAVACAGSGQDTMKDSQTESTQGGSGSTYAVGSSTLFIHDTSRPYDSVAGVNTGVRTMIAEIWYPADKTTVEKSSGEWRRATYGDYVFGNREVHKRMMTQTTFFHLTPNTVRPGVTQAQIDEAIEELFLRERTSWVDAPLADSDEPFPVVVMTHGDAGSRYNMETVCEYLAAHGYVVIAPEHTGNSPYAMTGSDPALAEQGGDPAFRAAMADVLPLLDDQGVYGSPETFGQSYSPLSGTEDPIKMFMRFDQSLLQRLNDLRATLDELDQMNSNGRFEGRLELDRIGLIGRSFGGSTTLVGLGMEPRFTSGFAVVPLSVTGLRTVLPPEVLVPSGQESAILAAEAPSPFSDLEKPTFLLSGAEDTLIIMSGQRQAEMTGTTMPTVDNPLPALHQSFEDSAQPVVWSLLADSNHATLGVSGGYWWPELKPDTAQRSFSPDTSFKLIDPVLAHQMQKEKALAFFDLTIRQDASAQDALLDDSYASQGLTLEARNMPGM